MKKYLYGMGKKFWIYASILIIISELLITVGILTVVMLSERTNLEEQYVSKTENMYCKFDSIYRNFDILTEELIINDYIQMSLTDEKLSKYDMEMINRTLFYLNDDYISYYFYWDNQNHLYTQKKVNIKKTDLQQDGIEENLNHSYAKTTLMWLDTAILGDEGDRLVVGRKIHHLTQDKDYGIVLLVLKSSFFADIVGDLKNTQVLYFILDDSGKILEKIGDDDKHRSVSVEQDLQNYINQKKNKTDFVMTTSDGIIFCKKHEESGFYLTTFVPNIVFEQIRYKIIGIISLTAVGALGVTTWMAGYFSRRLSKPIREISERMEKFEAVSLTKHLSINTNTELDSISESYNMMLKRISKLMEEIKKQQEELKKVEMEVLIYQIHPHFLYNTLGSIYMLARLKGEQTIMNMIDALSKFLRLTLSNGEETITIKDEIEHVCAYMEILRTRNNNMFDYQVECEKEIKNYRILKLIFQPLAENAIKHGFAEKDVDGMISIKIWREDKYIHFSIHDNGIGIKPDVLKKINAMSSEVIKGKEQGGKGVGIRNVVYRLKLRYGEGVHFWYESEEGSTTGHITIEVKCLQEEHRL